MKNESNFFGVELIVLFLSAFNTRGKKVVLKRSIYDALLALQEKDLYSLYFENYSLASELQAGIDEAIAAGALEDLGNNAFKVTVLNARKMIELKKKITVGHALLLEDFIWDIKNNQYE